MSASTHLLASQTPPSAQRKRLPERHVAKILALGAPAVLLAVLYLTLLVTPIRLPFGSEAAQAIAQSVIPPTSQLQLGDMALAVEGGFWPVIHFSPVVLTDTKTGAKVQIEALEIGFSPIRALFGQPGATVTIVKPHIQIVQDLFGPRVTSFELLDDPEGGAPTVRVLEGQDAVPTVSISSSGLDLRAPDGQTPAMALRSDNDWLVYNLESSERSIADIVAQAEQGRFSRLVIRDGIIDMNDTVYGLFRRFEKINLEIAPTPDGRSAGGDFSTTFGGKTMVGSLLHTVDDTGQTRLEADITNIDFASFLPFIDDAQSMASVRGAGALSINVRFAPDSGKLLDGAFKVDLTGLDLRIEDNYFPIASSIMNIAWSPAEGQFKLADAALQIGQSSARISGIFALGLDADFGPTIGMSMSLHDVVIHPNDMAAPAEPFDTIEFSGWSAPLYGALGIDRLLASKGLARVEATGRVNLLRAGLGLDMTIAGEGVSADDLKRLWPYFMGGDSRDWFVANVSEGTVAKATMRFKFPVGTMAVEGEEKPIPKDSMMIDMVGKGVKMRPTTEMTPIAIEGDTKLQLRDSNLTISAGGGAIDTGNGIITVTNPGFVMDNSDPAQAIAELSGDISGAIPSLLALAQNEQPEAVANTQLPIDLASITGSVNVGLVATIKLSNSKSGRELGLDYVLNGAVKDFASSQPIQNRKIGDGQLSFSASQDGYRVAGTASIDGMKADVEIVGTPSTEPTFRLGSTVEAKDLAAMGFDASEFLTGSLRFVAQPQTDGSIQVAIDLMDAGLTVKDVGITKAAGVPGSLVATIHQTDKLAELSDIDLAFGTVHLAGGLTFDAEKGLQSAEFSQFALSDDDSAQLKLAAIDGGYAIDLTGAQLDLKPMLKRFFGLGEGAGGVQATQFTQTLTLKIHLDRALGYYATTAFNMALDMTLQGTDMHRADMTAQFGDDNALSVTTNPAPDGRTLTVAFSDAGTILRLLGIYARLAGGDGSLVLTTDNERKSEVGQLQLRNFSIVDEANVTEILGNHADSREVIAKQNRLDFDRGQITLVRRSDRIEVTNAIVSGATVGGTLRGFIYTDQRQYDLTGTYVPLFGLNSAFQKMPLFGPLLGGRDGEGLFGVTFAVKGPLDKPQFQLNPLSALLPGAFRELFEFRAKEQPRIE